MAVNLEGGAPYAPSTAITEFLKRHRNGGIPSPVTAQTLERLGISESLRPRTLQALRQLDFIDADGNLTAEFENLRKVPTPDYLPKLAQLLRAAYADVFTIVDPSGASYQNVHDAFRGFNPAGQMNRMVALFLALLEYTGQWESLPSPRASGKIRIVRAPQSRKVAANSAATRPAEIYEPEQPAVRHGNPVRPSEYSQTVELEGSAGTVTLSVDVNPIKLKGSAREFFYSLVDMLDDYASKAPGAED
jgi:hypothetical protein